MPRILVVDDNAGVREFFSDALKAVGHEVRVASDGTQALRGFDEWRPHVILLDLFMPNVDGLDVLNSVRERSLETKVIVMSGGWAGSEQALALGANAALAKPVDLVVLRRTVASVLGGMPRA